MEVISLVIILIIDNSIQQQELDILQPASLEPSASVVIIESSVIFYLSSLDTLQVHQSSLRRHVKATAKSHHRPDI